MHEASGANIWQAITVTITLPSPQSLQVESGKPGAKYADVLYSVGFSTVSKAGMRAHEQDVTSLFAHVSITGEAYRRAMGAYSSVQTNNITSNFHRVAMQTRLGRLDPGCKHNR